MVLFFGHQNKLKRVIDSASHKARGIKHLRLSGQNFTTLSATALTFLLAPVLVAAVNGDGSGTPSNVSEETRPDTSSQLEASTSNIEATVETKSTIDEHNSTNVTVNGQSIPVPENGSLHRTITSPDNQSTVDIHVENHSSSNSNNTSRSSRVEIRSDSSTEVDIRSSH